MATQNFKTNGASMKYVHLEAEAFKAMKNQSKKAFREVGKGVARDIKAKVNGRGYLRKGVVAKVELNKATGQEPCLLIGYKKQSVMRDKVPFYVNPSWYENGVKGHEIKPLNKGALSDGSNFYGAKVWHRGTRANKVLEATVKSGQTAIIEAIKTNLKQIEGINLVEGDTAIEESEEELT